MASSHRRPTGDEQGPVDLTDDLRGRRSECAPQRSMRMGADDDEIGVVCLRRAADGIRRPAELYVDAVAQFLRHPALELMKRGLGRVSAHVLVIDAHGVHEWAGWKKRRKRYGSHQPKLRVHG